MCEDSGSEHVDVLCLVAAQLQQIDDLRACHGLNLLVLMRAIVVKLRPRVCIFRLMLDEKGGGRCTTLHDRDGRQRKIN